MKLSTVKSLRNIFQCPTSGIYEVLKETFWFSCSSTKAWIALKNKMIQSQNVNLAVIFFAKRYNFSQIFLLHDEQEIGEMEANLVGDLRAVIRFFGAQTQQREEKQTVNSQPEGPEGFLRILDKLSLIFPLSRGQFLEHQQFAKQKILRDPSYNQIKATMMYFIGSFEYRVTFLIKIRRFNDHRKWTFCIVGRQFLGKFGRPRETGNE